MFHIDLMPYVEVAFSKKKFQEGRALLYIDTYFKNAPKGKLSISSEELHFFLLKLGFRPYAGKDLGLPFSLAEKRKNANMFMNQILSMEYSFFAFIITSLIIGLMSSFHLLTMTSLFLYITIKFLKWIEFYKISPTSFEVDETEYKYLLCKANVSKSKK